MGSSVHAHPSSERSSVPCTAADMWVEILLFLVLLGALLYRYITKSFDKWQKMGVAHETPKFPYGTHNFVDGTKHLTDFAEEDYNKYKIEQNLKVHGWFMFGKPTLSINDVELIKQIQVKDFNHFVDRNEVNFSNSFAQGGKLDKYWGLSLDNATGDHWKKIRSTFTPIFTSGKIKVMFKFIKETSQALADELSEKAKAGEEFELKGTFGKFSLDALASCAFGVDAQSFTNPKSVFVKHAADTFALSGWDNLMFMIRFIPGANFILEAFNINVFKPTATKYLSDVILKTLEVRRKSGGKRNDLIDLMLDCIEDGDILDDKRPEEESQFDQDQQFNHKKESKLSNEEIVATAMVFLVAGYDTTGMTLSFLAYAMSKNPEIQEKLQEEVDEAFEENNGELPDYNKIQSLPYLDMVIHETLRRFSPVGFNTRSCTEDYNLPGTDIVIKKDDFISFSVSGIHNDPEFYSHPDEFYPDHFSKEEKATRSPYAFQSFGQGPRSCIGMRFALLEAKMAILCTYRKFSFLPGTKTQEPLVRDPESALGYAKGGLWAKIVERDI